MLQNIFIEKKREGWPEIIKEEFPIFILLLESLLNIAHSMSPNKYLFLQYNSSK